MMIILGVGFWVFFLIVYLYEKHPIFIDKPRTKTYNQEVWDKNASKFLDEICCSDEEYEEYRTYVLNHIDECMQEVEDAYTPRAVEIRWSVKDMMNFINPRSKLSMTPHGLYSPGNVFGIPAWNIDPVTDINLTSCHLVQIWVAHKYGKMSRKIAGAGYFINWDVGDTWHAGVYERYLMWLEAEMKSHGVQEDMVKRFEGNVEYTVFDGTTRYVRTNLCLRLGEWDVRDNGNSDVNFAPLVRGCPDEYLHRDMQARDVKTRGEKRLERVKKIEEIKAKFRY